MELLERRRFLTVCGLAAFSGCSSTGGGGDGPIDQPVIDENEFRQKLNELGITTVEIISELKIRLYNNSESVGIVERRPDENTYFSIEQKGKNSETPQTYRLALDNSTSGSLATQTGTKQSANITEFQKLDKTQREAELAALHPNVTSVTQSDSGDYEVQLAVAKSEHAGEGTTPELTGVGSVLILIISNPEVIYAVLDLLKGEGDRIDHIVTIAMFLGKLFLSGAITSAQNESRIEESQPESTIEIKELSFDPRVLEIGSNNTVEWVNKDSIAHSVTSTQFGDNSGDWEFNKEIPAGGRAQFTYGERGVYHYYCRIHGKNTMCGAVIVGENLTVDSLPCELSQ